MVAAKATKAAAEKVAEKYCGKAVLVQWGAKFSRTHATEKLFGKASEEGFFASGNALFKRFGSQAEIEALTGPLFSTPQKASLYQANRAFYAVERASEMGGGTLPSEFIIPYQTSSTYLRVLDSFELAL